MASHPLRLTCPSCRADFYVQRDRLGHTVTCPDCLDEFVAAEPGSPEIPSAPFSGSDPQGESGHDLGEDRSTEPLLDEHPLEQPDAGEDSGGTPEEIGEDYEFDLECPLCGTRQDATRGQIGQQISCPDCFFLITVREPPRRRRRKRGVAPPAEEELRLSEPEAPRRHHSLAQEILNTAAEEVPRENARRVAPDAVVRDAMTQAQTEVEAEEATRPRLPRRPLTTGVLGFIFELRALVRCLLWGLALAVEVAAIEKAVQLFSGGPVEQFLCVMLSAFCVVFGVFTFLAGSVMLLAVLQDTAIGRDVIEDWPEGFLIDGLSDAAYVFLAGFFAVLPGVLIGQIFLCAGGTPTLYTGGVAVSCALSAFLLFPVFLLSALEMGSPVMIYSRRIARTLNLLFKNWLLFYALAIGLVLLGIVLLQLYRLDSFVVDTLVMVGVAALLMIYFRLLGRLAWCCREAIAEVETQEAAADLDASHGS